MVLELGAIIALGAAATGAWWKMNSKMNKMNREIGETKVLIDAHLKNFNGISKDLKEHIKESNNTHLKILSQFRKMNGNDKNRP